MTPMQDLDLLLPGVATVAAGCPEPLAIKALRSACSKLCERTRQWRETETIAATSDTGNYNLSPPGGDVLDIVRADFNGSPLKPVTPEWLDEHEPLWRYGTTGRPVYVTQERQGEVIIAPQGDGTLTLWMTLRPDATARQVPAWIIDNHRELVEAGALADLLAVPSAKYYDPNLAALYYQKFTTLLDKAASRSSIGQQRTTRRTRAQLF